MGVFYRPGGDSSTIRCILPFYISFLFLLAWPPHLKIFLSLSHPTMSMPPVHMVLTASVLHSTTYTLPVPWYTLGQYAIALTIRLLLMCIAGDSVLINCINQASGGGQLTFKRNSRRRPLPISTNPYQYRKRIKWPLPSLTKSYARHAKPIGQLGLVV